MIDGMTFADVYGFLLGSVMCVVLLLASLCALNSDHIQRAIAADLPKLSLEYGSRSSALVWRVMYGDDREAVMRQLSEKTKRLIEQSRKLNMVTLAGFVVFVVMLFFGQMVA